VARSFITIPFVVGGRLAGALGVGSIDRLRPWTTDEVTALRLTTGLVAAVLERDRLARQAHDVAGPAGSGGSQTDGSGR
jgi:GAF domain-containing protein